MRSKIYMTSATVLAALFFIGAAFQYCRHVIIEQPADWIYVLLLAGCAVGVIAGWSILRRAGLIVARSHTVSVSGWVWAVLTWIGIFVVVLAITIIAGGASVGVVSRIGLNYVLATCGLGVIMLCWYVWGRWCADLLNLRITSPLGHRVWSVIVGIVLTLIVFYGLALARLLYPVAAWIWIAGAMVVGRKYVTDILNWLQRHHRITIGGESSPRHIAGIVTVVLVMLYGAVAFVGNSVPVPLDGDSTYVYFNIPNLMVQHHGMIAFAFDQLSNSTLAANSLYAFIILISPHLVSYINIVMWLLIIGSLVYAGVTFAEPLAGMYAALIFMAVDMSNFLMLTAKNDHTLVLLIVWAWLVCWVGILRTMPRWLVVSGVLVGVAIAIKYTALFIVPGLLLGSIWLLRKKTATVIATYVTLVLVGIVIGFAPWGVRQTARFGNPLYPFSVQATTLHRSTAHQQIMQGLTNELSAVTHRLSPANSGWQNVYHLLSHDTQYPNNQLGLLTVGLIGLWLFAQGELAGTLLSIISITGVIWFFTSVRQVWYVLYIMPLIAVLHGHITARLQQAKVRMYILGLAVVLIILQLPLRNAQATISLYRQDYRLPFTAAAFAEPELYLNNHLLPVHADYVLLPLGGIRPAFVIDNHRHLMSNFALDAWARIASQTATADEMLAVLRREGVTHVYFNYRSMDEMRQAICLHQACPTYSYLMSRWETLRPLLMPVAQRPDWVLYQVPS